jgi:flagellin
MEVFIMSMVVRTNTMAMSANSALNKNNSTVAGNLQKLSTGFRINRAADDASGLAVSEKMKAQIKALDQASKNAQDGASLIKTAEGYMGEVHDMLNRIVELAEKSANGTFETKTGEDYGSAATDRKAIQDEVDQLTTEIDRIANTANFNQLKLMDGSLDAGSTTSTGGAGSTGKVTQYSYTSEQIQGKYVKDGDNFVAATAENTTSTTGAVDLYARTGSGTTTYAASDLKDTAETIADASAFATAKANLYTKDGENAVKVADDATFDSNAEYFTLKDDAQGTTTYSASDYTKATGIEATTQEVDAPSNSGGGTASTGTGKALKLQIGETSGATDKLEVSIMNFQTSSLLNDLKTTQVGEGDDAIDIVVKNESDAATTAGIDGLTFNVSNQDAAAVVAEKVRDIINKVSEQRATLGAMENRLDYTMNNLDTASQNITDANSRIRDTDMAKTMMEYTQGNTLTQAAQAMLAQANQAPSQVLQLLQ